MKLKLMDVVYYAKDHTIGQVFRIRNQMVTIKFINDNVMKISEKQIKWNKNHWRING